MEMGQCRGRAQAQRIENLNSAASGIYHKKDCLCQGKNSNLGQMGIKKPPTTDVWGRGGGGSEQKA
jgi:hypothetical protein